MTTAPRFEHTVGSHSDDRGGDADARCACQDMTSSPDNKVEEILTDLYWGITSAYDVDLNIPIINKAHKQAKQSLDSHYLSIFLELVGEDEPKTGVGDIPNFSYPGMIERNNLRAELRTALQDRLGGKS